MAGPAPDKRPRDEHPDARVPGSGPRSAADRASPAAEPDAGASRSPVERVLERTLVDDSGLGRPLSRRAATTQRTVEAYLKTGVRPRWMERVVEIDQGIAAERRRLERAYRALQQECGRDRALFARLLARRRPRLALRPGPQRPHRAAQRVVSRRAPAADEPADRRLRAGRGPVVPAPRARARMGARAVPGVAAGGRLSGGRVAAAAPRAAGRAARRSGRQAVREVGQRLGAVLGDEHEVLDAGGLAPARGPGLDRDDVARDERLGAGPAEPRRLVDLEPDAVAEAEVEALGQRLPGAFVRCVGWPAASKTSQAMS